MSIETRFDVPLIARMASREKQIQQHYRPIIAVHKWFARRPGTLFRGLILAEFRDKPLVESFFAANDCSGHTVADPFMGGGTPLLEANRVGCDVFGCDINPMSRWVVREEIDQIDLDDYRRAAGALVEELAAEIGPSYRTDCPAYGDADVPVKYFLWVKTIACSECGTAMDLFPGYLVASDARHPAHVILCAHCGALKEVSNPANPGPCPTCAHPLTVTGPARRGRCVCHRCGHLNRYPCPDAGPPRHRLFAIEYFNPARKAEHRGRFFKKPDARDIERYAHAENRWSRMRAAYVPDQRIPSGDETGRLHRWGYRHYRELFNDRQLLGLELSARRIAAVGDERIRRALATNFSDLLRYQNMLCRYETAALKSLDIFSVHGFPAGLVHCESNMLGIVTATGAGVGSGGWNNIIAKYEKAKRFCKEPFEVEYSHGRKTIAPVPGEWIGEQAAGRRPRRVRIRCGDSADLRLAAGSLDAVFTDPPYFANVQYGELMDFCYVWLRRLAGSDTEGFEDASTRSPGKLTGNTTQARNLDHFTDGITSAYRSMARALKPARRSSSPFTTTRWTPTTRSASPSWTADSPARPRCRARPKCEARSTSTGPDRPSWTPSSSAAGTVQSGAIRFSTDSTTFLQSSAVTWRNFAAPASSRPPATSGASSSVTSLAWASGDCGASGTPRVRLASGWTASRRRSPGSEIDGTRLVEFRTPRTP